MARRVDDRELIHEARRLVADLRKPSARIFWTDLLVTTAVLWTLVVVAARSESLLVQAIATIAAGFVLSRALLFVHEITHMRRGALPGFRLGWNVLVGVPFLMPSFVYETLHNDHHKVRVYRTEADPEHAPDSMSHLQRCLSTIVAAFFVPVMFVARWSLAPVSFASPRLRRWVVDHASGLTLNLNYRPAPLKGEARRNAHLQEAACSIFAIALLTLIFLGWIPVAYLVVGMAAMGIAFILTMLRGEILHRFSNEGPWGNLERQLRDSVNVPHTGILTRLVLPVGIGYHALHHLDVALPYHAMPEAHARLMAMLPAGSLYHRATSEGLLSAAKVALADDLDHHRPANPPHEIAQAA